MEQMWYLSWVYTFGRICHRSKCIIILFILRINTIFVCKFNMDKYDKCHIWITFTQHSSRIKSNFSPSAPRRRSISVQNKDNHTITVCWKTQTLTGDYGHISWTSAQPWPLGAARRREGCCYWPGQCIFGSKCWWWSAWPQQHRQSSRKPRDEIQVISGEGCSWKQHQITNYPSN